MTEPLIDAPRTSADGTHARTADSAESGEWDANATELHHEPEVAPGTPRWVKAFGIILVVLLLAFAGLHLSGNAPTHMGAPGGMQHSVQAP